MKKPPNFNERICITKNFTMPEYKSKMFKNKCLLKQTKMSITIYSSLR